MKTEIREHNGQKFLLLFGEMQNEFEALEALGKDGARVSAVLRRTDNITMYLRIPLPANAPVNATDNDGLLINSSNPKFDKCRACSADIFFAKSVPTARNPHPKSNPLDATPTLNGNISILKNGDYIVLSGDDLKQAHEAKTLLYTSHFSTCPERDKFRNKQ